LRRVEDNGDDVVLPAQASVAVAVALAPTSAFVPLNSFGV